MTEARGGRLDLLHQGREGAAATDERPIEERPGDETWRADALGRSRHSRLDGPPPSARAATEAEAEQLCAGLCRTALRDFAPALFFLSRRERRRLQALVAHTFTLFDFARQRGVEGERLAQINRWEFTLEAALTDADEEEGSGGAGESARSQPIFRAMAREHRHRRWPEGALDDLAGAARNQIGRPVPATVLEATARDRHFGAALLTAFLGEVPAPELADLVGTLLALRRLRDLGEELRQKRSPLAAEEMPAPPAPGLEVPAERILEAGRQAARRLLSRWAEIEAEMETALAAPAASSIPPAHRRAARYGLLAGRALARAILEAGPGLLRQTPTLGLGNRLRLLLAARWPALAP